MENDVLHINFTGINAYALDGGTFVVIMPNATKLGPSPIRDLPPHFPTMWLPGGARRRYHFWETVELAVRDGEKPRGGVQGFSGKPALRIRRSYLTDPSKVSCVVRIPFGNLGRIGPCKKISWNRSSDGMSDEALAHTLRVEIRGFKPEELVFRKKRFGGKDWKEVGFGGDDLTIGNACAEDILGWPSNDDVGDSLDHDFGWMYVAPFESDNKPLPMTKSECGLTSKLPFKEVKRRLDTMLSGAAGGGGCGCRCVGCLASIVEK